MQKRMNKLIKLKSKTSRHGKPVAAKLGWVAAFTLNVPAME